MAVIPLDDFTSRDREVGKGCLHDGHIFVSELKVGISHMLVLDLADNHLFLILDEKEPIRLAILDRRPIN